MPTDIRIIRAHEFIQASPEGVLDLAKTEAVLKQIALASAPSDNYDVVLDIRNAELSMSVTDLWHLAAELHRYREAFSQKTAVLVSPEQSDYAGFFSVCAQERGFEVSAFTRFGDAMEWLDRTQP